MPSSWMSIFLAFVFVACKKDKPLAVDVYSINPGEVIIEKDNPYLTTLQLLKNGEPVDATTVVWKSQDENTVFVDESSGVLYANWAGQTVVIAYDENATELARCSVTVTDANVYKLRLKLKDKGSQDAFSLNRPSDFLSEKAISRRNRHQIEIDEDDLPISVDYLDKITNVGCAIVAKSKWLATVSVHCNNGSFLDRYRDLPFVEDIEIVWKRSQKHYYKPEDGSWSFPGSWNGVAPSIPIGKDTTVYGQAYENIKLHNGHFLHQKGYKGQGMNIAVIDARFQNIDQNSLLDNIYVLGAKSFVYEQPSPFAEDDHGVWVLSCMAGAKPSQYVGTAPEAAYLLLATEDMETEYPIEEDYFVQALEYADSVGVDIVNSSLYYTEYYDGTRHSYEALDGNTAHASRGANMASAKGILVVTAAGNNGDFVGTPADSPEVIAVGMINRYGDVNEMSARGMTVDGRIKPDVAVLGAGAYRITAHGTIDFSFGTSYASPVMAGMAACLWQAFPHLTNKQIAEVIRQSGDRHEKPVLPYGHGIPDMQKAYELASVLPR